MFGSLRKSFFHILSLSKPSLKPEGLRRTNTPIYPAMCCGGGSVTICCEVIRFTTALGLRVLAVTFRNSNRNCRETPLCVRRNRKERAEPHTKAATSSCYTASVHYPSHPQHRTHPALGTGRSEPAWESLLLGHGASFLFLRTHGC